MARVAGPLNHRMILYSIGYRSHHHDHTVGIDRNISKGRRVLHVIHIYPAFHSDKHAGILIISFTMDKQLLIFPAWFFFFAYRIAGTLLLTTRQSSKNVIQDQSIPSIPSTRKDALHPQVM